MKNLNLISKIFICSLFIVSTGALHARDDRPLRVVTTLNYLKYVAEQVGRDHVSVTALANPKQDPHFVTPTPRMNQIARAADLFVENGLSLDSWSKNVIDASGNPDIQPGNRGHLVATINVPVKELPMEVSRAWGDIHPQGNPHVWLDPINIKIIASNIAARLVGLDPEKVKEYEANLQQFRRHIDEQMYGQELLNLLGKSAGDILDRHTKSGDLERWLASKRLKEKLGGWMKQARSFEGTKVIAYHKSYVYFADRFGIDVRGELEEKPGIPPPPQHRDAMVEKVKSEQIRLIMNENFYSREASDYVAAATGASVVTIYIEVGAAESIPTYESLIGYLLGQISIAR